MQLGMIGLGRMGANMRQRIRAGGHEVIGYDKNPAVRDVAVHAVPSEQLEDDINEATVQVLNLVIANRQKVNLQGVPQA